MYGHDWDIIWSHPHVSKDPLWIKPNLLKLVSPFIMVILTAIFTLSHGTSQKQSPLKAEDG